MLEYYVDLKEGKLFRDNMKNTFNGLAYLKKLRIYTEEEFKKDSIEFAHKRNLLSNAEMIRCCKIEKFSNCLIGTMKIPGHEDKGEMKFAFCILEDSILIIEKEGNLKTRIDHIKDSLFKESSLIMVMLILFRYILEQDFLYLQRMEEKLEKLEETLIEKIPSDIDEIIMAYRRRLSYFHEYYQQLVDIGDEVRDSLGNILTEDEKLAWQHYSNQAERYHNNVEMLREYLVQLREFCSSRIAERQNKTMSFLTIITSLFFPLTLITGWYGMNFNNMPELDWAYAYPVIIIVSIVIITAEIIYFKKKKML